MGIESNKITILYQHASVPVRPVRLAHNGKKVKFLFMGNIGNSQNLANVIEAFSKAKRKDEIQLDIVGSGSRLEQCVEVTNRLGLNDTVFFHGRFPKEELGRFYESADVGIVSLKDEEVTGSTIPGTLQEYMGEGLAILGCINGDAQRLIRVANCGICVNADDCDSLANAIDYFVNNKEHIYEMGEMGKKYFSNHFTLSNHVKELEIDLMNMISQKPVMFV